MPNRWFQISPDYWMCIRWDVWREHGVWQGSSMYGRRINKDFASPEEAMKHINKLCESDN